MIFDLAEDFRDALGAMPKSHTQHRILTLLEEAIQRDIHFIDRHPTTLFQCMWNTCWWYDAVESRKHYRLGGCQWPGNKPPWEFSRARLSDLMSEWRGAKNSVTPSFCWLRSLRPPPTHLNSPLKLVLMQHETSVESLAYSSDGRRLASGADNVIHISDAISGKLLFRLQTHSGPVRCLAFSPDSQFLASGSADCSVRLWFTGDGSEVACLDGHEDEVACVAFSRDGRRLASGGGGNLFGSGASNNMRDYSVRVWDIADKREIRRFRGHEFPVRSVSFPEDSGQVISAGMDATVWVWDIDAAKPVWYFHAPAIVATSVALSPCGEKLVIGSSNNDVHVCDIKEERDVHCLPTHDKPVVSVAYSPDGKRVLAVSNDAVLQEWDARTGNELICVREHKGLITTAACSPDGNRIATGGDWSDAGVRVWQFGGDSELRDLIDHESTILSLQNYPDRHRTATGSVDGAVYIWDTKSGELLLSAKGKGDAARQIAYSRNGQRLLVVSSNSPDGNTCRILGTNALSEIIVLPRSCECASFSPDGSRIITSEGRTVNIWDTTDGQLLNDLPGHEDAVRHVAFSDDGTKAISASWDGTVRVWDTDTGVELQCLSGHPLWVEHATFAASRQHLAIGSNDTMVRVWDIQTGDELCCLIGHQEDIFELAYSPDGHCLVSNSRDGTTRLWDVDNARCSRTLPGYANCEDIAATIAKPGQWALIQAHETVVQHREASPSVGWYSSHFTNLRSHGADACWAGTVGCHLDIVVLEGEPPLLEATHGHGESIAQACVPQDVPDGSVSAPPFQPELLDPELMTRIMQMGMLHQLGNLASAIEVARDVKAIVGEQGDQRILLSTEAFLGEVLTKQGDFDGALPHFREMERLARDLCNQQQLAAARRCQIEISQLQQSAHARMTAQGLDVTNPVAFMNELTDKTFAAIAEGRYAAAKRHLRDAYTIYGTTCFAGWIEDLMAEVNAKTEPRLTETREHTIRERIEQLSNPELQVRQVAAHALESFVTHKLQQNPVSDSSEVQAALRAYVTFLLEEGATFGIQPERLPSFGRCVVPFLIEGLGSASQPARAMATATLGQMGPDARQALPALIDGMAAGRLARMPTSFAIDRVGLDSNLSSDDLLRVVEHGMEPASEKAVRLLGDMIAGSASLAHSVVPRLVSLLGRSDAASRKWAAHLAAYAAPSKLIIAALQDACEDSDVSVQRTAQHSLRSIRNRPTGLPDDVEKGRGET